MTLSIAMDEFHRRKLLLQFKKQPPRSLARVVRYSLILTEADYRRRRVASAATPSSMSDAVAGSGITTEMSLMNTPAG